MRAREFFGAVFAAVFFLVVADLVFLWEPGALDDVGFDEPPPRLALGRTPVHVRCPQVPRHARPVRQPEPG